LTSRQQKGLLRNTDLRNHFIQLKNTRTMVLGCDDLTVYNPHSDETAAGWRKEVKDQFKN